MVKKNKALKLEENFSSQASFQKITQDARTDGYHFLTRLQGDWDNMVIFINPDMGMRRVYDLKTGQLIEQGESRSHTRKGFGKPISIRSFYGDNRD